MAILRPLTRIQREKMEAAKPAPKLAKPVFTAAERFEIACLIEYAAPTVKRLPTTGKPLRAQKWYQPDYTLATPKGITLKSDKLRGVHARWSLT